MIIVAERQLRSRLGVVVDTPKLRERTIKVTTLLEVILPIRTFRDDAPGNYHSVDIRPYLCVGLYLVRVARDGVGKWRS